jgi:hypothetical protein
MSSILWQQYPSQESLNSGGSWSWQDARRQYAAALTNTSLEERGNDFADTFLALGHLTHLVQDASVPAHTRNDDHLLILDPDGYEAWVEATRSNAHEKFEEIIASSFRPSETIFTSTGNPQAPVPVARLIDTDQFDGLNGAILTSNTIGMSEYTNGNFVSDDTIFLDFLLPRPQSLSPGFFVPEGQGQRQYFSKVGAGEQVDYFVAEGVWDERLRLGQTALGDYVLTDRVFEAYARKLLPRAVGYSAALLNYFFRGRIDMKPDPNVSGQYIITNLGPETLKGEFNLYYDDAQGNRYPVVPDPTNPQASVPWPTQGNGLAPQATMTVTFTPRATPAPKTAGEYMLVFKGEMGEEEPSNGSVGAVAAKTVNLSFSSFLLITSSGIYRSQSLGNGWERIGDSAEIAADYPYYSYGLRVWGEFINEHLLFLTGSRVWKSEDGGRTFVAAFDPEEIDSRAITYLGGTELLAQVSFHETLGFKNLYSPDLGATWQVQSEEDNWLSFLRYAGNGRVFSDLVVEQSAGLSESLNKGITWSAVKPVVDGDVLDNCTGDSCRVWEIGSIAWNQVEGEGNVLLVGGSVGVVGEVSSEPPFTCCLWKSRDGGNTWRHIATPLGIPSSIALSPTGEALMIVVAYNSATSSFEHSVYKSTDAGEGWELTENPDEGEGLGVVYLGNRIGP